MIEVKRLSIDNLPDIRKVTDTVRKSLVNDSWFIPMSDETMDNMFAADTTLSVYGAFDDGVLAAVALIDIDPEEMLDLVSAMDLPLSACGELGACVVLPDHRGKNLMYLVCRKLISIAQEMGLKYLVASAHPDNIASNRTLQKLGMEHVKTLVRCGGYIRNAYRIELDK